MKATPPQKALSRRAFLGKSATSLAGIQFLTHSVFGEQAPSNKLNLACIGAFGMGMANLYNCRSENIVALCDVDTDAEAAESSWARLDWETRPEVRMYTDFRELLDSETDLDGVIIATPDHTHAVIAMAVLAKGLHVYCQKPLTHTLREARTVTQAALNSGVVTQMGNQGKSAESIRLLKEWIEDGAIGNVTEVHAWTDRPVGGNPWSDFPIVARPEATPPIPETLDWDLWLGPAQERPYHPIYHPKNWRGFIDFGTGALGDMGCHILDPAFYALDLGPPDVVEATTTHYKEEVMRETFPRASRVRYHFPARGSKPPVTLNWSDGRLLPFRPEGIPNDVKIDSQAGAIIIGDEGVIMHGGWGASGLRIFPDSRRKAYLADRAPKTIPRVKGTHEEDWLKACKGLRPCCSPFEYGGALTEMVLLGVLAIRKPNVRLEWDSPSMTFPNFPEADALVHSPYREGWTL